MAEEENRLLDEMIAQNQKHNLDRELKKNAAKVPAVSGKMRGTTQSPTGYASSKNPNSMVNLNKVQKNQSSPDKVSKVNGLIQVPQA